ncbi:hypothetical protein E5V15_09955 (plasmid) [Campylobacter jejuni]|nr:hypothetical protein E5V15_09955 [Campylobacter jejuni]
MSFVFCFCYYNYTFFILSIYLIYTFFICYLYVFLNPFCTKPKTFSPFFAYRKPFLVLKRSLKEFIMFARN